MAAGCGSTGISPRPMLMGAAHDALRASNARVSLSCLRILAHRLPHLFYGLVLSLTCLVGVPSCGLATGSWRTGRPAPHRQILSDDLRQHIPVRQIAERFSVSETSLKNYF